MSNHYNDDSLFTWDEIKENFNKSSILIGNGLSQSIWSKYSYKSLFEIGCSSAHDFNLLEAEIALFKKYDTHNYEKILSLLNIAIEVLKTFGQDSTQFIEIYERIKNCLIHSIHSIHIPWSDIPAESFEIIRNELRNYEFVFTTNYDLILYWSIMHKYPPDGFRDYFFSDDFDLSNVDIWDERITKILYLHGGIHLYKPTFGNTIKRRKTRTKNLLEIFGDKFENGIEAVPLMVTEGSWQEKLNAIQRSDYLQFAYEQLKTRNENIVIYGHSLSDEDLHIYKALEGKVKKIAISIYHSDDNLDKIKEKKRKFNNLFTNAEKYYFSYKTHPLGNEQLKVR